MDDILKVGKIVNTHGISGEVRIIPITDFVEERFQKGQSLLIKMPSGEEKTVTIKTHRKHKQFELVTFDHYETIHDVEPFKGLTLYIAKDQLHSLPDGEFYYYEIIGCSVVTDDGQEIGEVKEILSPGANDVWVVSDKNSKKEYYIPYIDDVVLQVDIEEKKVIIHPMEGLLG
ncbi:ribosome maturation factor RimM [Massilibacterium senegalense]|uniref:ribosome maturation factor RimM n=1 Tax=Massilibacterium senegalense TaxID=1632858 RepID=UPI0007830B0A|nr:ribosome maturation factor RimM [Massilibacterium senegalense]